MKIGRTFLQLHEYVPKGSVSGPIYFIYIYLFMMAHQGILFCLLMTLIFSIMLIITWHIVCRLWAWTLNSINKWVNQWLVTINAGIRQSCVKKKANSALIFSKFCISCINFFDYVLCEFFLILHFIHHICNKFHENGQLCNKYFNFLCFLPCFTYFQIFLHLWRFRVFCFFLVPFHFFHL